MNNLEFPLQQESAKPSKLEALYEAMKSSELREQAINTFRNYGRPAVRAMFGSAMQELGFAQQDDEGNYHYKPGNIVPTIKAMHNDPEAYTRDATHNMIEGAKQGLVEHASQQETKDQLRADTIGMVQAGHNAYKESLEAQVAQIYEQQENHPKAA